MAQLLVPPIFGEHYCESTYMSENENQIIGDKSIKKTGFMNSELHRIRTKVEIEVKTMKH